MTVQIQGVFPVKQCIIGPELHHPFGWSIFGLNAFCFQRHIYPEMTSFATESVYFNNYLHAYYLPDICVSITASFKNLFFDRPFLK